MPILFAMLSRGTTPLAKFASCPGNFLEVVEPLLSRLADQQEGRMTYSHGQYLFHYAIESGVISICITEDSFDRARAFAFLASVSRRFSSVYGYRLSSALPYAMNSEFAPVLATEMRHFSASKTKLEEAQVELDGLKEIMVQNIDSIASRGERLELLVSKAESLSANSVSFRANSRSLARKLWWKNVKFIVLCVLLFVLCVYAIVSFACGGLAWQNCVH